MRRQSDPSRRNSESLHAEDRERDWRLLVCGVLVLGFLLVLARAARADSNPGAGALLLHGASGDAMAPWLDTEVDMHVSGMIARVTLRQRFINDQPEWVEGVYAFPLPDAAAVHALRMRIGERVIEGEVRERDAARAVYAQARSDGRRASLVEQSRPNVFRTSVANLAPYDTIEVELEYLEFVRYDAGAFSLRFPMTITPRYEAPALLARAAADEAAFGPDLALHTAAELAPGDDSRALGSIHVELDPGFALADLTSAYHAVRVASEQIGPEDPPAQSIAGARKRYVIDLAAGKVPMDRDFELTWKPDTGTRPAAAVFTETLDGEAYALIMLVPNQLPAEQAPPPREMILVIDTSGSMEGTALAQAKSALALALTQLGPRDRFNVIRFASTTSSLYGQPVANDATTRAQALAWVDALEADGGTEMAPALAAAFAGHAPAGYLRQVVFVTDGGIADEDGLFGQIHSQLGDARLFTVGIGAAPNAFFMRKAAQLGRGDFTFIGKEQEVGAKMQALLGKLASPALTDIEIAWPATVEAWPARTPDLYAGNPVIVSARLPALAGEVSVRATLGGRPWSATLPLTAQRPAEGVVTLWARRKIDALMDAERRGDADAQREIVEVALRHGLVSAYTSFVAVDSTPARAMQAALQRRDVPMLLPATASDTVGYPQTATDAPLRAIVALLLLIAGSMLRFRRTRFATASAR